MPTVEKTHGGPVYHRGLGQTMEVGDQVEASEELAAYLCEERGDFAVVDDGDDVREEDGPPDDTVSVEDAIDHGVCPWCDDYEGENVGQHASSAHPDAWDDYKEG